MTTVIIICFMFLFDIIVIIIIIVIILGSEAHVSVHDFWIAAFDLKS